MLQGDLLKIILHYGNRTEGKGNGVKLNLSSAPLNQNSPVRDNNELQESQQEGGAVRKNGKWVILWVYFEMWELGVTNTELMASKLTPEHCTHPQGLSFQKNPTNSSCEENEGAPHFVVGSESPSKSPDMPT